MTQLKLRNTFDPIRMLVELDRAEQLAIIAVNILAMTDLSLRFSDHLIRHRGGILNLGSLAGFLPGPGMAVYYASKAYVLSFSEALRAELAPYGVRVTVLCPGPVPSKSMLVAPSAVTVTTPFESIAKYPPASLLSE